MKKILIGAFVLVALVQLYVPAKMIFGREEILLEGKEFRFKSAPVDPNDPFRGKYIILNYENSQFIREDTSDVWTYGDEAFVVIKENEEGFAVVENVLREEPEQGKDYVKATISHVSDWDKRLVINYPFDRFYMDEYLAPEAETVYREAAIDSTQVAYAVVRIKNGEAVVADVVIDGESIKEIIKRNNE